MAENKRKRVLTAAFRSMEDTFQQEKISVLVMVRTDSGVLTLTLGELKLSIRKGNNLE